MAYTSTGGATGNEVHYFIYDISADLVDSVKDTTDAYAYFELGEHNVKTEVAKNAGSNPVWTGDQYKLRKHHGNEFSQLIVSVYAKKTLLPDGLIGRGEVPLSDLVGHPKRVQLMDKRGESMGEIMFQVREEGGAFGSQRDTSGMGTGLATDAGTTGGYGSTGTGQGVGTTGLGTGVATGAGTGAAYGNTGTGQREGLVDRMKDAVGLGPNDNQNRGVGTGVGTGSAYGNTGTGQREGVVDKLKDAVGLGPNDSRNRGTGTGTGMGTGVTTGTGYDYDDNTRTTTTTTTTTEAADVCDRQVFTTEEDRPIVKEQKVYTKEHHNFEKEYAVETKFIGERKLAPGHVEALGVEERIVETTPAAPPCADAPAIGQQVLGNARNNPTY